MKNHVETQKFQFGDRRYTLDEIFEEKGIKAGKGVTPKLIGDRLGRGMGLTEAVTKPKQSRKQINAACRIRL